MSRSDELNQIIFMMIRKLFGNYSVESLYTSIVQEYTRIV